MFQVDHTDGLARAGLLTTSSGSVNTPFFMPVATKASVKYLESSDLLEMGNEAIISNAFVLFLRPGDEYVKEHGGIKKFMNYHGVNVTDSGGFQMYSDAFLIKTTDEGVWFKSPFDGKKFFVTPEKNMQIQFNIGSDIAMNLDVMPNFHGVTKEEISEAVRKTTLWAKRCREHHDMIDPEKKQLLFGITQGGVHDDLRTQSITELKDMGFDGLALGGLGMGENPVDANRMVKIQRSLMDDDQIMYMMGIGNPVEICNAVAQGADMFDSRMPTMMARRGTLFTSLGKLRIARKEFNDDQTPIDPNCSCRVCKNYTRAYIKYQLEQGHGTGQRLVTYHNLYYMTQLMREIRKAIVEGRFEEFRSDLVKVYADAEVVHKKLIASVKKK